MENIIAEKIKTNVPLAPLTTINLGGPAAYFMTCPTVDALVDALTYARAQDLPVHILGGGSNTVFADEGFAGLVIQLDLRGVEFQPEGNYMNVTAAAAESWDEFVLECVERKLAGLECLSGIPGLVGATPMQNVGAYGQEVAGTITSVTALDRKTLKTVTFTNTDCQFGYRRSRFKYEDKDRYIITHTTYRLEVGGPPTIKYPELQQALAPDASLLQVREAVLELRRKKSMVLDPTDPNSRSCGSFFTNPIISANQFAQLKERAGTEDIPHFPVQVTHFAQATRDDLLGQVKVPAAWLIEQAGFRKGERRGGVGISTNHVLALVNYGGTTEELLTFAEEIQTKVKEKFGVLLALEPVVVQ